MQNKYRKLNIAYEALMIILVITSLIAMMSDSSSNLAYLHRIIWIIFLIDVSIRFYKTTQKWGYIKDNPFDIISVIPLEDMFLLARFSRLLRLFRYKNAIKRYLDRIESLVNRMKFIRVTFSVIIAHILISLGIVIFTSYNLLDSIMWVELNFFKFNYVSENKDFIALSIIVKIAGILYIGVILNKVLNYLKKRYDDWRYVKEQKKKILEDSKSSNNNDKTEGLDNHDDKSH